MHSALSLASRLLILLALALPITVLPASGQTNPPAAFGGAKTSPGAPPSAFGAPQAAPTGATGPFGAFMRWVAETQQDMHKQLAASVKRLKSGSAIAAALALAGLSFLYGVVHAVGPGHGKAIISSYVVANEETVRRGVAISFLAAAMQAVTAVALVSVLLIALNATGLQLNAWASQLESASYALIALVGLYLLSGQLIRLWRRFRARRDENHGSHAHGNPDHDHVHAHHHHAGGEACADCGHMVDARQLAGPFSWRKALAVILSVGIRPCTGAILVLVFALTQGLFWAGVAATFAMALGTALTVAVLASLALGSRELALKLGGTSSVWADAVWSACAIGGALVIFLFGSLLFIASLGPARPF
jgi:ABC-type nickel/cobalt efflux system permease component RcnA